MNRLATLGILPNLSPVVKFVGGPWDGWCTRMPNSACPEFVEMQNEKITNAIPHQYQLWVVTDKKGVTHTMYKHRGPKTPNQ